MSDQSRQPPPPRDRRHFFGDAVREAMGPLARALDRRVTPMLQALEQLPRQVEAAATRDQPHVSPPREARTLPRGLAGAVGRYLRPPGALPAGEYEMVCSRCGKCVEVCPAKAIRLDQGGLIAEGAPYIVPREMPCVVCDSLACMQECPTGALKPVPRVQIGMGTAKVDQALCVRAAGQECRICLDICPMGTAAIGIGAQTGKIRVHAAGCIGCGLCEQACPPAAIAVWPPKANAEPIVA